LWCTPRDDFPKDTEQWGNCCDYACGAKNIEQAVLEFPKAVTGDYSIAPPLTFSTRETRKAAPTFIIRLIKSRIKPTPM